MVIVRINVILSIYVYLFLEYMRTFTPKWIVFHFLNLWKLGEGGKMNKVLGMLEAGNAACQANCINKTKTVATTIYFFFIRQLFFGRGSQLLKKTVSVALPMGVG